MDGLKPCSGAQGLADPRAKKPRVGQVCWRVRSVGWSAVLAGQLAGQLAFVGQLALAGYRAGWVGQLCLVVSPGRLVASSWLSALVAGAARNL